MSELVSVIVPVYNGEKYLEKCLDSIISQTYPSIQLIIIDDGSSDNTFEIAEDYKMKHQNIEVIHKKNAGLPQARKTGIENATGDYIVFVDADDWIDPTMISVLMKLICDNQADISTCGMMYEYANKSVPIPKDNVLREYSNYEALIEINKRNGLLASLANKMIRRELFDGVEFGKGNYTGEDYDVTTQILCKPLKMVATGEPLYHYLQKNGSMCHSGYSSQSDATYEHFQKSLKRQIERFPESERIVQSYIIVEYLMIAASMGRNNIYNYSLLSEIKKMAHDISSEVYHAKYMERKYKIGLLLFNLNYMLFIKVYVFLEKIRRQ